MTPQTRFSSTMSDALEADISIHSHFADVSHAFSRVVLISQAGATSLSPGLNMVTIRSTVSCQGLGRASLTSRRMCKGSFNSRLQPFI
jgi:hypothetical protein